MTITVTAVNDAPVISDLTGPSAADEFGHVTGTFTVTDVEDDAFTITATGGPASGEVQFSTPQPTAETGVYTVTYTYTPFSQARVDAYDATGPLTDTFTITVTETGADQLTDTETVTGIQIKPAYAAVVATLTDVGTPSGVAVDANGYLYVGDKKDKAVLVLAPSDTSDTGYELVDTIEGVPSPYGLAVDANGYLFVANTGARSVTVIAPINGDPTNGFEVVDTLNQADGIPAAPTDIAIDPRGYVYVTGYSSDDSVAVIAPVGGDPANGFEVRTVINVDSPPTAVAVDQYGYVYVATVANQVKVIDPGDYSVDATTGYHVLTTVTGMANPQDLAVDEAGYIYVANLGNSTLTVIDPGDYTAATGFQTAATIVGVGNQLYRVGVDEAGRIYVANFSDSTLTIIEPGDRTEAATGYQGVSTVDVGTEPRVVTIGPDGTVYTASVDDQSVSVIDVSTPTNSIPVAGADEYTITEDSGPKTITTADLLANDNDPDGNQTFSFSSVSTTSANGVTLDYNDATGEITYTPPENFNGTDQFTYTIVDIAGTPDTAVVTINITPVDDAPVATNDDYTTYEDDGLTANVLGNDYDADDPAEVLTVATVNGSAAAVGAQTLTSAGGFVTLESDGAFIYTPAENFNGTDSFTYTVTDSTDLVSNTATVAIQVVAVNDAPTANDDTATTPVGTDAVIGAYALLANDTDADLDDTNPDTITITGVSSTGAATVTLAADGSTVTYQPVAGFNGVDTFTYTISDSAGATDTATVTITVGSAPVISDVTGPSAPDAQGVVTGSFVVTDAEDDPFEITSINGPTSGEVQFASVARAGESGVYDVTYTYTPDGQVQVDLYDAGQTGTDAFTISVAQIDANYPPATLEVADVTVAPVYAAVIDAVGLGDSPQGMDIDTDGYVYVANYAGNSVSVIDPDTHTVVATIALGAGAGPRDVAVDNGYLYVANSDASQVVVISVPNDRADVAAYTTVSTLSVPGARGVTAGDGYAYATVWNNTRVTVIAPVDPDNPDGGFERSYTYLVGTNPAGVARDPSSGNVYVANQGSDSVTVLAPIDSDAANGLQVVKTITGIDSPTNIAIDDAGYVYVATSTGMSVIDPDNGYAVVDVTVTGASNPFAVAVDDAGRIYLGNTGGGQIVILTPGDRTATGYQVVGTVTTAGATGNIREIVVADDGTVYASNATTDSVSAIAVSTAANSVPVAGHFTRITPEGTSTSISATTLVNAATDADGDPLYISGVNSSGTLGTLSSTADFNNHITSITYTPPAGFHGTDTFTYTLSDGTTVDTGVVTIVVDDAPTAVNDDYTVNEDTELTGNVLTNDTDPDIGDTLTATLVSGTAHGSLVLNTDGSFSYTGNENYTGTDAFTYTASDPAGATSNEATVTITVNPVNDVPTAVDDDYTVNEDAGLTGNVLTNDTDPDIGDTLTATLVSGTTHGTLILNADGSFSYTGNENYTGTDAFTYTASDPAGATSNEATVTITIDPVNDAPRIGGIVDPANPDPDGSLSGSFTVTDPDADTITVTASDPASGSIDISGLFRNGAGSWLVKYTYTPDPAARVAAYDTVYNGGIAPTTDSFTITVTTSDSTAADPVTDQFATALDVTATIDPAYAVVTDYVDVGSPVSGEAVDIEGYLYAAHQSSGAGSVSVFDPNRELVTSIDIGGVAAGVATDANGYVYAAATVVNQQTGNDEIVVSMIDPGTHDPHTATDYQVLATINLGEGVADAVAASADGYIYVTDVDNNAVSVITPGDYQVTTITVNNPTSLAVDSDGYVYVGSASGSAGTVSVIGPGTDPDTGYQVINTITLGGGIVGVTVDAAGYVYVHNSSTISVIDPGNRDATTGYQIVDTIDLGFNLYGVGVDTAGRLYVIDPATLLIVEPGTRDTATGGYQTAGTADLSSNPGLTNVTVAPDGTTYLAGPFNSSISVVTVSTATNPIPVARVDYFTIDEDTELSTTVAGLISNDTNALWFTGVSATSANGGTVQFVPTPGGLLQRPVVYTPPAEFSGTDTFTYTITDSHGTPDTGLVTITVTAVNDAPTAADQDVTAAEDGWVTFTAAGTDVDGDNLTVSVVSGSEPANGTVYVLGDKLTYVPTADFNGTDTFKYTVSDGEYTSNEATVTVHVTAVNDAPIAGDTTANVNEDSYVDISVPGSDVDGDTLTAQIVTGPANGTISINGPEHPYTPNTDYNGADTFTYTLTDGSGAANATSNQATVSITIDAVNDAPMASDPNVSVAEDGSVSINLRPLGSDIDNTTAELTFTIVSGPSAGSLTPKLGVPDTYTYTPNPNVNGTDSFTYQVSDGQLTDTGTAHLTITPVNDAPTANNLSATIDEDTSVTFTGTGTDIDGETLTAQIVTGPANGTISITGQNITYTPNTDYNGADTFTYSLTDGTGHQQPGHRHHHHRRRQRRPDGQRPERLCRRGRLGQHQPAPTGQRHRQHHRRTDLHHRVWPQRRQPHPQTRCPRHLHLHPQPQRQRHRLVHLPGQRRPTHRHRHRPPHHHTGQRRPDREQPVRDHRRGHLGHLHRHRHRHRRRDPDRPDRHRPRQRHDQHHGPEHHLHPQHRLQRRRHLHLHPHRRHRHQQPGHRHHHHRPGRGRPDR